MSISNYQRMLLDMRERFLRFEQQPMTEKFSLDSDAAYLYLPMLGRLHRIHRTTALVEYEENGSFCETEVNAAATIYDILCCSKPNCTLSGQFAPINSVAKNYHTQNLGGSVFDGCPPIFARHPEQLEKALIALGGVPEGKGDIAYRVNVFPFFPLRVQFWAADDEFPASLQILWDLNTLDYLHYETTYYLAGHLLHRLRELITEA